MAGRADIEAGKAHILLYIKNSALMKGLGEIRQRMQGLGSSIMRIGAGFIGLGGSLTAPLAGAILHFSAAGSELADMSARTGEAAGSLAELKFAAEQTGAGLEDVEKAIIRQQKNGSLLTFDQMAQKIAAVEDPAERTRQAIEAWGKTGPKLLPMAASLKALRQEARDLGLVPTEEAVNMADAIGDALDKVQAVINATVFELGAALAPMLLPALETVKNMAGWFNRWAKENGSVIRTVALIGVGLVAAGAVLVGIGATIFGVGAAFGVVATVLTGIGTVLGAVLSPVGLIVVALLSGVAAWARFTESGRASVSFLMDRLGEFLAFGREVIGGIGDALMAGDLALAAQIGWQAVLVVFETVKLQLMRGWFGLRETMIAAWGEVTLAIQTGVAFVAKIFTGLLDQLVPGWQAGMAIISAAVASAWKTFKTTAMAAFAAVRIGLEALIARLKAFISGLQVATKIAVAAAPAAMQQGNQEIKKFLGVDVGKLFGDAAVEAGKQNAAGREKLNAEKAGRGAADAAALSEQEKIIAQKKAELAKLGAEARAAREAAAAPKAATAPGAGLPDVAAAKASFVSFSAAAAVGNASRGSDPVTKTLLEMKRERKEQFVKEMEMRREYRKDVKEALRMAMRP